MPAAGRPGCAGGALSARAQAQPPGPEVPQGPGGTPSPPAPAATFSLRLCLRRCPRHVALNVMGVGQPWTGGEGALGSIHPPHREVQGPPPSPLSLGPSRSPPGPWVRPRRPHSVGSLWGTWSWLLVDGPGGGDRGRKTAPPRALVMRQAARVSLSHRAQPLPGAPAPACGVSGGGRCLAWASSDLRRLL